MRHPHEQKGCRGLLFYGQDVNGFDDELQAVAGLEAVLRLGLCGQNRRQLRGRCRVEWGLFLLLVRFLKSFRA